MFDPKDNSRLIFDPYFLLPPICVLCVKSTSQFPVTPDKIDTLEVTPILAKRWWLYWFDLKTPWTSNTPPKESVFIGEAGGRRFYADSYPDFADFLLMTLPLPPSLARSAPTAPPPQPSKGGRQIRPALPPVAPPAQIPGSTEGGIRPNYLIVPQILPPPPQ